MMFVCLVLVVILGLFYTWYSKDKAVKSEEIRQMAEALQEEEKISTDEIGETKQQADVVFDETMTHVPDSEKESETETETETETELDPAKALEAEAKQKNIMILNGTGKEGMAGYWKQQLTGEGYEHIVIANYLETGEEHTII